MLRTSHAPPSKENVKDVDPDFGQTIQRKCDLWTVQTSSQRWGVSSKRRVLQLRFFDVRFRTPGCAESGNLDRDAEALLAGGWHKEASHCLNPGGPSSSSSEIASSSRSFASRASPMVLRIAKRAYLDLGVFRACALSGSERSSQGRRLLRALVPRTPLCSFQKQHDLQPL